VNECARILRSVESDRDDVRDPLVSLGGVDGLEVEQVQIPRAGSGEALVRVHAAGITRD
jgi:hypothetical protein